MANTVCDQLQGFYDNPKSVAESDVPGVELLKLLEDHPVACERCSKFFRSCSLAKYAIMQSAMLEKALQTPSSQ